MALNISFFASIHDTEPVLKFGLSWGNICNSFGAPKPYLAKESAPLYSPAEWLPGRKRGRDGVMCVHFGVLDLDHWSDDDLVALVASLVRRNAAYYLASTWSHGQRGSDDNCARLLLPFSRPVLASEWSRFWPVLNDEYTGGRADSKCKDIGRSYFFPAHQEGANKEPFHDFVVDGENVDVDALLARVGGAAVGAIEDDASQVFAEGLALTPKILTDLGRRYSSSASAHRSMIGKLLLRVAKGEAYAREPGTGGPANLPEGRNDTTYKLIATIAEAYPHVSPDSVVSCFAPSIAAMGGEPTHDEIAGMVQRLQEGARKTHSALIYEAIGRHEPYSEAELQSMADRLEVSVSQLRRRWVIQRDRTYYLLKNGSYRLYTEAEAANAAMIDLAPAITAGVDTVKITQQGSRRKTPQELVADYGIVARNVILDMTAQHSYFDAARDAMVEAPCPIRVKARRHEDVEQWLRVFAGAQHERLLQWIASLPVLGEPCAALYLEGERGTGKSLLGYGLCRLWNPRPTTLTEAFGAFNATLASCPFVFGDETTPDADRGIRHTSQLREFIQARTRPLMRKYMPNATLIGCARVLLAANNQSMLETNEQLTEADVAAIVERLFYLKSNPLSRDYLQARKAADPETMDRWVGGDAIAEHAMWLAETLVFERQGRFMVEGQADSPLVKTLVTGSGLRASVCHWCVEYLLNPGRLRGSPKRALVAPLIRVSRGRLLVTSRAIVETWTDYIPNDKYKQPRPMEVAKALGGISKEITLRTDQGNQKFREVNLDDLETWASRTGYCTRLDIEKALNEIETNGGHVTTMAPDRSLS
ncbi:MAG: primase-helicase family protein [Microbacterium sp.]